MKTEQLALFLISPDSTVVEAMQRRYRGDIYCNKRWYL